MVLANHFRSKGYGTPGDRFGAKRRARQAARVADIVTGLLAEGITHVAVAGDLKDDPSHRSLAPPVLGSLTDAMVSVEGEAKRPVTWVTLEEVAGGEWGIAGKALHTGAVVGTRAASS